MKFLSLLSALACIALASCFRNDHNVSIVITDDEHDYSMEAHFPKNRDRDVAQFLDNKIGENSRITISHAETNAAISLDDHTIFDMKKSPGMLLIHLNKDQHSTDSYREVRLICLGIKNILAR